MISLDENHGMQRNCGKKRRHSTAMGELLSQLSQQGANSAMMELMGQQGAKNAMMELMGQQGANNPRKEQLDLKYSLVNKQQDQQSHLQLYQIQHHQPHQVSHHQPHQVSHHQLCHQHHCDATCVDAYSSSVDALNVSCVALHADLEDRENLEDLQDREQSSLPASPASSTSSSGVSSALHSLYEIHTMPFASGSPTASSCADSGAEEDPEDQENHVDYLDSSAMELVSNLVEVQGICHINLLQAQFIITHNEQTNDFFLDLVRANRTGDSVLQVIFRFPKHRNGTLELFSASYGAWSRAGRLVYYDDSPACTPASPYGSCRRADCSAETSEELRQDQRGQQADTGRQSSSIKCRTHAVSGRRRHYQQHWHLQLHVYERDFTIELNGQEIHRFAHRFAFEKVRHEF